MSLTDLFQEYSKLSENDTERGKAGQRIIDAVFKILEKLKDPATDSQEKTTIIKELTDLFAQLPNDFFDEHVHDVLSIGTNVCDTSVYKAFEANEIELDNPTIQAIENIDANILTFRILNRVFEAVKLREVLLFLNPILKGENKNPQLYFLFIEILIAIMKRIDKKEKYVGDLLIDHLYCVKQAISKYHGYKNKADSKRTKELSTKAREFLENFEKWSLRIIKRTLTFLEESVKQSPNDCNLLTVQELEAATGQKKDMQVELAPSKKVAHYSVLFLLDLLDVYNEMGSDNPSPSENTNSILKEIYTHLLKIHPYPRDFIENYNHQVKYQQLKNKEYGPAMVHYQTPDKSYDIGTFYNPFGVAYILREFLASPNEIVPLSFNYKLRLIMPLLQCLLASSREREALKIELLKALGNILFTYHPKGPIENLNHFGVSLVLFIRDLLQYTGTIGDEHKGPILKLFKVFMSLLTEEVEVYDFSFTYL